MSFFDNFEPNQHTAATELVSMNIQTIGKVTMKPKTTWILIADAGRARIVETHRALLDSGFRQIETFENELSPTREIVSDRPGRAVDSRGGQRHAMELPSDPHKAQKAAFAETLASRLNRAAQDGSYDRLVVAAAPVLLGQLRAALGSHASARLAATLDKDLTHVPLEELPKFLGTLVS